MRKIRGGVSQPKTKLSRNEQGVVRDVIPFAEDEWIDVDRKVSNYYSKIGRICPSFLLGHNYHWYPCHT